MKNIEKNKNDNKNKENQTVTSEKKEKLETTPKKKRLAVTLIATFALPFILLVATPLIVFSNNINEFLFSWKDFLPLCFLFAVIICGILFSAIFFLPERAYRICLHIVIAFDLLFFIQSTYLNGSMSLSGDNMGGSPALASKIINLIFWVLCMAGFVVLAILKDKKKYIKTVSLVLCVVVLFTQFVSALTPMLSNKNFFKTKAERDGADATINYLTYKNLNKYSTTDNVYYFIIDRFDENYAEEAVSQKADFFSHLTGFTWFQDNIALYGHTFPAMAYLLTGIEYSCELDRGEYFKEVYSSNNYLQEIKNAGYDVNIYSESYYTYTSSTVPDYISNKEPCTSSLKSKFKLAWRMAELGVYVGSPLFCKSLFNNMSSSAFDNLFEFTSLEGYTGYTGINDIVLPNVEKLEFEETTNKQFNVIHIEGCHEESSNNPDNKNSSYALLTKSFKIINTFIDNLKDKGLYDEATIVITGDHAAPYNHFVSVYNERRMALFFKPSQTEAESQEALKTSKAKVEQKNIMPTIFESIGVTSEIATANGDTSLFVTDSAERKHVWHTYVGDVTEYIYKITGDGSNFDNWHEISKKTYNRNVMD